MAPDPAEPGPDPEPSPTGDDEDSAHPQQSEYTESVDWADCGVRLGFSSINWRSNACNCRRKWKFGDMSGLRKRTNANASSKLSIRECIKQAKVTVTERETPAKQCTNTAESFLRASSTIYREKNQQIQDHSIVYARYLFSTPFQQSKALD